MKPMPDSEQVIAYLEHMFALVNPRQDPVWKWLRQSGNMPARPRGNPSEGFKKGWGKDKNGYPNGSELEPEFEPEFEPNLDES